MLFKIQLNHTCFVACNNTLFSLAAIESCNYMQPFQADVALQFTVTCFNEAVTRRKTLYAGSKNPDGEIAVALSELIETIDPNAQGTDFRIT